MSLDPLVSFLVPLGEVEAVAQRDYVVWAHVVVRQWQREGGVPCG